MRSAALVVASCTFRRFLLCIICFFNDSSFAGSAYLKVYPVISLAQQGRFVNIEKIAKLVHGNSLSAEDIARINAMNVEIPVTDVESRQYLDGAEIKNVLISALNERDRTRIGVSAPPRVVVRMKAGAGISSSVVEVAKSELQNYLDKYYQRGQINLVAVPDINYQGKLKYVARQIVGPVKKRMAVWVDISDDERLVQSALVWFDVKAHVQVFVLKKAVTRGEVVNHKHLAITSRDIDGLPVEAVRVNEIKKEQFANFIYGDDISRKEILDRRFIRRAGAINFGDDVKVISKVGNVSITTRAIAQGTANIDEKIRLMTLEGKEIFWGKVVGRKQVVVEANP
jgi:flagella basal body P-ring formation protein FlgA